MSTDFQRWTNHCLQLLWTEITGYTRVSINYKEKQSYHFGTDNIWAANRKHKRYFGFLNWTSRSGNWEVLEIFEGGFWIVSELMAVLPTCL